MVEAGYGGDEVTALQGIPPLSPAVAERVVALTLAANRQPLDGRGDGEGRWDKRQFGATACGRIRYAGSGCPTIRTSRPSSRRSSGSIKMFVYFQKLARANLNSVTASHSQFAR